jgi:hypothetical protein
MANTPQVVITISPAGSVTVDAQCFTGSGCAKATEQIEIVLGGAAKKTKKKKPEAFSPQGVKQDAKLTF